MYFESPYQLLWMLPFFFLWAIPFFMKERGVLFPSLEVGTKKHHGIRAQLRFIPHFFLLFALVLLVITLAKPTYPPKERELKREGIAIELVIDNSSSMAENMIDGLRIKRKIDLVKEVAFDFVMGTSRKISGRENDLIGLVTFARYANTIYPLTFNRTPFAQALAMVDIADRKVDGTHFGAGLQMAIARLETVNEKENQKIKSKIIIFLTDGQNHYKDIDPIEMAHLAKEKNIRIYTIAFATRQQELLSHIAVLTEGAAYEATNSNMLSKVYADIDQLEKSKLEDAQEAKGEPAAFLFLLLALIAFILTFLLDWTLFRRFP